ncbi:MAG: M23 family peptidase, partial [Muribaculaceae bacterium]|nr:M23 family peptidase [Muribaculaceae bacterium]
MKESRTLYTYNPATDNFERYYPSWKDRLSKWGMTFLLALIVGGGLFALVFFVFLDRTERELREENSRLRAKYNVLERRV